MEKSIESIWKEGFLKNDKLIVPKLNDLYNQKSKHVVDKYRRMLKINLQAIVIGSFVVLLASFLVRMPVMGVMMFFLLNGIVLANRNILKELDQIDKSESSYQYLKSFENWMNKQLTFNRKLAGYYYPYIFLSIVLGFWFIRLDEEGTQLKDIIINKILLQYPETYLVFGVPVIGLIGVVLMLGLLAFYGGRIYNWDVRIVYGRVLNKLEELLKDMEELSN